MRKIIIIEEEESESKWNPAAKVAEGRVKNNTVKIRGITEKEFIHKCMSNEGDGRQQHDKGCYISKQFILSL